MRIKFKSLIIDDENLAREDLKALLKDARTSFTSIAKDCGITTTSIVQRFSRMKKSGIIVGTALRLNMKDFEHKYAIGIDLDVDQKETETLIEYLTKMKNLISCYRLLGRHDVHVSMLVRSIEEIDRIRDKIQIQKGVKKVFISTSLDKIGCFPENLVIQPTENK